MVYGFMVYGLVVYVEWNMIFGLWFMVYGLGQMVYRKWFTKSVIQGAD